MKFVFNHATTRQSTFINFEFFKLISIFVGWAAGWIDTSHNGRCLGGFQLQYLWTNKNQTFGLLLCNVIQTAKWKRMRISKNYNI